MESLSYCIIILSGVLHAVWNTLAKHVGKNTTILWLAMSSGGWLLLPFVWQSMASFSLSTLGFWALLSGGSHSLYYLLLTHAYSRYPLSIIYPISRGLGIGVTSIISITIFNQHLSLLGAISISTLFSGIFLFYLPSFKSRTTATSILTGCGVGLSIASYLIIDYQASYLFNPIQLMTLCFVSMSILLFPVLLYTKPKELLETLRSKKWISLLIGSLSFTSYALFLWIIRKSPLSYILSLRESSILFAAFFAWLFLQEKVSSKKWLAIGLITLGSIGLKFS